MKHRIPDILSNIDFKNTKKLICLEKHVINIHRQLNFTKQNLNSTIKPIRIMPKSKLAQNLTIQKIASPLAPTTKASCMLKTLPKAAFLEASRSFTDLSEGGQLKPALQKYVFNAKYTKINGSIKDNSKYKLKETKSFTSLKLKETKGNKEQSLLDAKVVQNIKKPRLQPISQMPRFSCPVHPLTKNNRTIFK